MLGLGLALGCSSLGQGEPGQLTVGTCVRRGRSNGKAAAAPR